ncbi:MAG: cobalt-precorrin-5B (C(1))-methyltransferase [Desulfovibrio desulfuricans]|jgi:cobalt-precorrin-5B (C1)-methyltransferase|nr:cobalt-precorrin-5B (C(1))-methyltransferase [Desulfovibrio desulfuricans]
MTRGLREGFTTGSAATGAALAALQLLRSGSAPETVRVPLPPFTPRHAAGTAQAAALPRAWLELPVADCAPGPAPELAAAWARQDGTADPPPKGMGRAAHAVVIKDGGDDPDATSGARITATVVEDVRAPRSRDETAPAGTQPAIALCGGPGVGRVTLPGLPVPVGEPAINPVPREQLRFALHAATPDAAMPGLTVFISVPGGRDLAEKTLNPRLGIAGGISILGTQGTVRPFSHAAWKATIRQGLHVAGATGCRSVCLSTGRRSERLLMERYPALPARCFIQVADFAAFSLKAAGDMAFQNLVWGCFFGKLVKLAQGHAYTHAGDAALDMRALADLARREHAACADDVGHCVTAAHALELLLADPAGPRVLERTTRTAAHVAQGFARRPVRIHLFHTDGRELLAL